jgi:hypothetical protein
VSDAPDVEPLDFAECARVWRRKAEEHWRRSRRLDELAVAARRRAEAAEEMARYYDGLVADQRA